MKTLIASLMALGSSVIGVDAQVFTVSGLNHSSAYESILYDPSFSAPEWLPTDSLSGYTLKEGYQYDVVFLGQNAGFTYSDLSFLGNVDATGAITGMTESLDIFSDIGSNVPALTTGDYKTVTVNYDAHPSAASYLFDFLLDSTDNVGQFGFSDMGMFRLFYSAHDVGDNGVVEGNGIYDVSQLTQDWLVFAFEDLGTNDSDEDFNDLVFAIDLAGTQVPEPSTYGLMGALLLLALVGKRHMSRN